MKHILVTGGAGFIGSHVVYHHIRKGDQVWVVDNLTSGRMENLNSIKDKSQLRFTKADICNWPELQEAVNWADSIYNMAAIIGQRLVLSDPVGTLSNNIHSCERILQAISNANKAKQLMIISSSSVYLHTEPNKDGTFHEDHHLSYPSGKFIQETYPLGKLINEVMGLAYLHQKGVHCTIARIFNSIGPNQTSRYGMVVPTFIKQALSHAPLTVYGDGLQRRAFTNVSDTVNALDLLLQNPASKGEIVNVGSHNDISIIDLARLIIEITKSRSEIKYLSYQEAYGIDFIDVRRRLPNLQKLTKLIGVTSKKSLEETIKEIITSTL